MSTDLQFRTFQTTQRYENALQRHGQWVRWLRSAVCPCVSNDTHQADPNCSLCHGRGYIYRNPDSLKVANEIVNHNSYGKIYTQYAPANDATIWRQGSKLALSGTQPADGSYIQIDPPYPKSHERVYADYMYDPEVAVVDENSEVYGANILRVIAPRFEEKGKTFEGSISQVSKVYNSTKDSTYTVSSFAKEFIYLDSMSDWQSGDVLQVSYKYLKPFNLLLTSISQKMRYERAYILEDATALLVTPYFIRVAPNDLTTALSVEQVSSVVVEPQSSGNDVISNYYDISRLEYVVDVYGKVYIVGTDVQLYGRNELKWLTTKPSQQYSVQFYYHPTFVALPDLPSARNAENKMFVNRVNLMEYDKVDNLTW